MSCVQAAFIEAAAAAAKKAGGRSATASSGVAGGGAGGGGASPRARPKFNKTKDEGLPASAYVSNAPPPEKLLPATIVRPATRRRVGSSRRHRMSGQRGQPANLVATVSLSSRHHLPPSQQPLSPPSPSQVLFH